MKCKDKYFKKIKPVFLHFKTRKLIGKFRTILAFKNKNSAKKLFF
jgi:inorganic pyrophosphatase